MVTEVVSFGTVNPAGSANRKPAATENSAAPGSGEQNAEAAAFAAQANREQKAAVEREQKEREKERTSPQLDTALALDSTRLSILQDAGSKRFVYRGLNVVTKEVERQYPTDSELRRSALLRELRGSFIDELS